MSTPAVSERSERWKWWICALLLLATMLNYMDRLTLNQSAKRIIDEFGLNKEQYGHLELAFGMAFACGALLSGLIVDIWNVRWVYPIALLAWSAMGFVTGFAQSFFDLLLFRSLLGLSEAGHWPCALRTTQRILLPRERSLGNGLLQSGAALGAILTPIVILLLVGTPSRFDMFEEYLPAQLVAILRGVARHGSWREPFFVIGALGSVWVVLWLASTRASDLALPIKQPTATDSDTGLWQTLWSPRFVVLLVMVTAINLTWHFFRVWLPLYLQEVQGYTETGANLFLSLYYLSTDAGALAIGFFTLWLTARGLSVHGSRVIVFAICSGLTTLSALVAFLPPGPAIPLLLLSIGFGALGLFPTYYSLSQELTVRHQGKVTGLLGFTTWMASAMMHPKIGKLIDQTGSYAYGLALAGLFPLVALSVLVALWRPTKHPD
jgi:ACS family hexuronate transporter-like MFS transporter